MTITQALVNLKADLVTWCTNNFNLCLKRNMGVANQLLGTNKDGEIATINPPISVSYGGTGSTSAAGARIALGAARDYKYGTADPTTDSSITLEEGQLYFMYE